jgi:exopolysaccharide production protein ExoQ
MQLLQQQSIKVLAGVEGARQAPADYKARRVPLWECVPAAAALALLGGAGDSIFRVVRELDYYGPLGNSNEAFIFAGRVVLVLAAAVAARNKRGTASAFLRAWPLAACLAWAALSTLWSLEPARTLGKTVILTTSLVMVGGLVSRHGIVGITQPMRYAGWVVVILSLILLLLSPPFALHDVDYPGAFRGIFLHKNTLGVFLTCVIMCSLAELGGTDRAILPVTSIALLLASFAIVLVSESAAGLTISTAAVLIGLFLWLHQRSRIGALLKFSGMVVAVIVLLIVLLLWEKELLSLIGRESTLTGRTMLWQIIWQSILDRPIAGYGFGSYWVSQFGDPANFGWIPWTAHNGYLDAQLSGGIILLALILLQTGYVIVGSIPYALLPKTTTCWFIVLTAALLPIYNLVESIFLREYSLPTLLFAAAAFLVGHAPSPRRKRAAQ